MRSWARARTFRRALPYLLLAGIAAAGLRVALGWKPRARADFVFNNGAEVQSLDPATVTGIPEGRILQHLYEGLTVRDPSTLEPIPGQAHAWQISEDQLRYTFQLRPEARWSNGDPVTAHDFLWSYRRLLHPSTAATYAYQLWPIQGARAYSVWPDDLAASRDSWVRPSQERDPRPGEIVRIGLTYYALDAGGRVPKEFTIDPTLLGSNIRTGHELAGLLGPGRDTFRLPVSGKLVAFNETVAPDSVAAAPLSAEHWLVAVELDAAGAKTYAELQAGENYREEVLWPNVGIQAVDAKTLTLQLERPTPYLLEILSSHPLFPVNRKALEGARQRWPDRWQVEWTKPENLVTNGPFKIVERRVNDRIRMVKNPTYWDADNVAFRTIEALALEHSGTALNMYLTGDCDWLSGSIPADVAPRLREREDFQPTPFLGTYFYRINVTKPPLDDPLVRRALALAIDREELCEFVTKAGQQPAWGLVPPGLSNWGPQRFGKDSREEARKIMVEAGYTSQSRRLPTIEILYNTNESHRDIAEAVAEGWRAIGFDVKLRNQEWKTFLDAQTQLAYEVSRSVWIGDYADPNTFLEAFLSTSENNRTGWKNAEYDTFVNRAATTTDPKVRRSILRRAERILLDELPIIPIYYYTAQNLVNPRLGGFHANLLDQHPPKFWHWMNDFELKQQRHENADGFEIVDAPGPRAGLYSPAQQAQLSEQRAKEKAAKAETGAEAGGANKPKSARGRTGAPAPQRPSKRKRNGAPR